MKIRVKLYKQIASRSFILTNIENYVEFYMEKSGIRTFQKEKKGNVIEIDSSVPKLGRRKLISIITVSSLFF